MKLKLISSDSFVHSFVKKFLVVVSLVFCKQFMNEKGYKMSSFSFFFNKMRIISTTRPNKNCWCLLLTQPFVFFKKWQKFQEIAYERLEDAKEEISNIEEKLLAIMPNKSQSLKAVKEMKSRVKDVML